jgi:hypothetical protein
MLAASARPINEEDFIEHFARTFERETFVGLARASQWLRRQGKIDAFEFLAGLVFGQMSALRLTLNAQAACCTEAVSRQAVDQRYHERTVAYFRGAFDHCLERSLALAPAPALQAALAAHFTAIHLVDSSGFDCPASLASLYPGCGGDASPANVKLLLRYEYLRSQFAPVALVPGKRSDQGLAGDVPRLIHAGELLIADKAFVKLQALREIQQAGGYFLLPWPRSVGLYQTPPAGAPQALDLAAVLRASTSAVFERPAVQLGAPAEATVVRLVAFRLSEASASRARAGLREAQRKQGRTPSAAALELAGWLILLTNVTAEKLPATAVSHLYRVRWQIELVFKQCKSVLRLNVTEALDNLARVQCEIWARLIGALVVFGWHGHLQAASWARRRAELSFGQVARQLQSRGLSLAEALIVGGEHLRVWLWQVWNHLLVTTRKGRQRTRKTTWQALQENWLAPTTP